MSKKIIAIVPAGGVGQRAQAEGSSLPKQYRLLKGKPMLRWAVEALLAEPRVDQVRVAVAATDTLAADALQGLPRTVWRPCAGDSRALTVLGALHDAALADDDWVLVHDAARPGLPPDALARLLDDCLGDTVGGLLAQPVPDTVKQSDTATGYERVGVAKTVSREGLWLAQTPQMFPAALLQASLELALNHGAAVTDEASALEFMGLVPRLVAGSLKNFKVTWPEDFQLMEKWL